MKAPTTILAATMPAAYHAGDVPTSAPATGLTAAFVLGVDDTVPDAVGRSDPRLAAAKPGPLAVQARRTARVAAR